MAAQAGKKQSIGRRQRMLLFIILPVTLLDILVSAYVMSAMQREITGYVQALNRLQVGSVYDDFTRAGQSMSRMLVEDAALIEKAQSPSTLSRIQAQSQLIDKCKYPANELGGRFSFFYYFENTERFLPGYRSGTIPIQDRPPVYAAMIDLMMGPENGFIGSQHWNMIQVEGRYYAVKFFTYNNVWIGSCVPADTLMAPLDAVYPDKDGFAILLTADGQVATNQDKLVANGLSEIDPPESGEAFFIGTQRWLVVDSDQSSAGFTIRFYLHGFGQFEQLILLQAVFLFIILLTVVLANLSTLYTHRRVIRPLKQFVDGLQSVSAESPMLLMSANEISELEAANIQFRALMQEIRRLRIDIYEQRLAHQKMQMDFMQQQIKPHFFLNCLNIIHSMAKNGQDEAITDLSENVTRYLRYVFHSESERVPLEDELLHIDTYLTIIGIRYPNMCLHEVVVEDDVQGILVPPLLLHTFVENAVKHGVIPGRPLQVSISAVMESVITEDESTEEMLVIFITDNGAGFPDAHIALWANGEDLPREGGRHIGVSNALHRLHFAYGGRATARLYNSPLGGAVVELHLPTDKEVTHESADGG